jgi:type IV pilus assembly protein PilA
VSEGLSLADGAKTAIAEYYTNKGSFPSANASAGLASSGSITGNYVTGVNASSGVITVTYGGKANTAITNKTLQLSAVAGTGSITWTCKAGSTNPVPAQYLPSSCR